MSEATTNLPLPQVVRKPPTRWRGVVDWAKHRDWILRLAMPLSRGRGRWRFADRLLDRAPAAPMMPDLSGWTDDRLRACWLGHATTIVRVGGRTLLTDPVLSTRVGLGWGFGTLGPARLVRPALSITQLPRPDVILISHGHFDHLDRPTLTRLPKSATIVCANGLRDLLEDLRFARVIELQNDESVSLAHLRITAVPVRHWGARMIVDNTRGYCAFLVDALNPRGEPTQRVLFGGDSAFQEHWRPIGAAGGVDLAIVGIGAYDPWIGGHANPEQAWEMAAIHARARRVMPMHHRTFRLSNEAIDEPLRRMLMVAGERADDVVCRAVGECWSAA